METHIELYLNGKWPTSQEEWLRIRGKNSFMGPQINAIISGEMPSEILRNKRMSAEMIRLIEENKEKGYFFAVGVDHLNYITSRNPNILEHLQARGFHIERVLPDEILKDVSCRARDSCRLMSTFPTFNKCYANQSWVRVEHLHDIPHQQNQGWELSTAVLRYLT